MSFLDQFLYKNIAKLGTLLSTQRSTLNFIGSGVTVADNPTTQQTDVTITSGAASYGKINLTLANGTNSNQATDGSLLQVIGGPTAAFALGSVLPSVSLLSGQPVVFTNTTSQTWTIIHQDPSATGSSLKFSIPGATFAGASVRVFGKLSAHFDGTNLVPDLGTIFKPWIDVREYGATGNGTTDDTAAIQAAIADFEAIQQSAWIGTNAGSAILYFPAGAYFVSSPLVINQCYGGLIRGDGPGSTRILGETFAGMRNTRALLLLQDCAHTVVRDINLRPPPLTTTFSGCAQGDTSITVASAANLAVGQRIGLSSVLNGATAEWIGITKIVGNVLTLSARGTKFAYVTGDRVFLGTQFAGCSYRTGAAPFTVTANRWENCYADPGGASTEYLWAFGTDCLGGGPVNITATANSGQKVVTVDDVSQVQVGLTYSLWHNVASAGPDSALVVGSIDPVASTITFTANLAATYTAGGYVVSAADGNNELNSFVNCVTGGAVVGGFGIFGWNSLDHKIINAIVNQTYACVSMRQGGCVTWIGGFAGVLGVDFEIGGGVQHQVKILGYGTEGPSQFVSVLQGDNCQNLNLDAIHVDKKGGPAGPNARLIDITTASIGSASRITFTGCSMALGAASNQLFAYVHDRTNLGQLTLNGSRFGCYGYDYAGLLVSDNASLWESATPLSETLNAPSATAYVTAIAVRYGSSGGPTTRVPTVPVVAGAGANDNIPTFGSSTLTFLDPGAAATYSGFEFGYDGMILETVWFGGATPHQVTLVNNATSTAGNRLFAGTGANVVFTPAVNGSVTARWKYLLKADGTNPGWLLMS